MLTVRTSEGDFEFYFGTIKEVVNNFIYFETDGIKFHLNVLSNSKFNYKYKKISQENVDIERFVFMFTSYPKRLDNESRVINHIFLVRDKNLFFKSKFLSLEISDLQIIGGVRINIEKPLYSLSYVITAPFIDELIADFLQYYHLLLRDKLKKSFDEFNINKYVSTYKVIHKILHTYRPCGDDYCYTHIISNVEEISTNNYLRFITPKINISERYEEFSSGYQWKDKFIGSDEHNQQIERAHILTEYGKKKIVDMYDQEKHFISYFDQKSIELVNNLKFDIYSQGKKNKSELYFQFLDYITQQHSSIQFREDYVFTLD